MPRYCNVNSSGVLHSKHAQAASPPCRRATLAGRTVGEICDPQSIGPVGFEAPLHQISWTGSCAIRDRGANPFAAPDPLDAKVSHQTLHGAPRHHHPFSIQLLPDLAGSIDPKVLFPHTLDSKRSISSIIVRSRAFRHRIGVEQIPENRECQMERKGIRLTGNLIWSRSPAKGLAPRLTPNVRVLPSPA